MYPDSGYKLAHAQSVCTRPFSPCWEWPGDEATWRVYPVGMLQPSCPSYKLTLHQTPPFDQISGQHTIGSAQFHIHVQYVLPTVVRISLDNTFCNVCLSNSPEDPIG